MEIVSVNHRCVQQLVSANGGMRLDRPNEAGPLIRGIATARMGGGPFVVSRALEVCGGPTRRGPPALLEPASAKHSPCGSATAPFQQSSSKLTPLNRWEGGKVGHIYVSAITSDCGEHAKSSRNTGKRGCGEENTCSKHMGVVKAII
ncbi:hypothetical protein SLA2020_266830 [Shorea laevis]